MKQPKSNNLTMGQLKAYKKISKSKFFKYVWLKIKYEQI